jgi:hypothetical protein
LDKRVLAESKEATMAEIDAKIPFLLKEGGYIPMTDHTIPVDVTLEMFNFYIGYLRERFGEEDATHEKP